jgi:hypothetical protein
MNIERINGIVKKAKALLPHLSEENRKLSTALINTIESILLPVRGEETLQLPSELEARLEEAFKVIEKLYNENATN